jgi:hypothetical protein
VNTAPQPAQAIRFTFATACNLSSPAASNRHGASASVAPADRPGQGQVNPLWKKQRSLIMRRIWAGIFGTLMGLALGLAAVGCGSSTTADKDKMSNGNMSGGNMSSGDMSGNMSGGNMGSDNMSGGNMGGDKMTANKMDKK